MRISHRYRFIFFSSPKTGSESVRAFLDQWSDVFDRNYRAIDAAHPFYSHMRPVEMRAAFAQRGWPFEAYYRFVFVRNPWVRLLSLYKMIRARRPLCDLSFAAWLQASAPDGAGGGGPDSARWRKYGTYSIESFAGDRSGAMLVDDVFRLEDIAILPQRLRKRGIPIPPQAEVPWQNRSDAATDLARFYTPDLIELVRRRYAAEIGSFGYEFPG